MKSLTTIFLLASLQLNAQILMGPYQVGQPVNDVVYIGSYISPGNCTFNDGTDFTFSFATLYAPDGLEYVLIIDAPNPSNTAMMNGWSTVNVGDSTVFNANTTNLGISAASGPATLNFHVRLVGTATTVSEEFPCWITAAVSDAVCGNTYALFPGESLLPCLVAGTVGISEPKQNTVKFETLNNLVTINSDFAGLFSVTDMTGRMIYSEPVNTGKTLINLQSFTKGNYIVRFDNSKGTHSQKIALQ